jgi:FAD/FMN-containing dehydrogenase
VPRPAHVVTALCGFASVRAAAEAIGPLRAAPGLHAAELVLADGVALVARTFGIANPLRGEHPALLVVECADHVDPTAGLAAALDEAGAREVAVADEPARQAELWRLRELHTDAIARVGVPHKLDVAVPLAALAGFLRDVPAVVAAVDPAATTWLFGHAGDGNVHVNVTGIDPHDERVDEAVLTLVADLGGSISAEHGIGTAKRRWLHLSRSPAELATFAAIKRAWDPLGILNPEVLLSPRSVTPPTGRGRRARRAGRQGGRS